MKNIGSNVGYLLAALFLAGASVLGCHLKIRRCLQGTDFSEASLKFEEEGLLFSNKSVHAHFCRSWNEVRPCILKAVATCDSVEEKANRKSTYNENDFMCGEKANDFFTHHTCFRNPALDFELHVCYENYNSASDRARHLPELEYKEEQCRAEYDLLDCKQNRVKIECGEKASDTYWAMERHIFDPILQMLTCEQLAAGGFLNATEGGIDEGRAPEDACSRTMEMRCYLGTSFRSAEQHFRTSGSFVYNLTWHEGVCAEWKASVGACINENLHICADEGDKDLYLGEINLYNYICGHGFEEYKKHASCFENDEIRGKMQHCRDEYSREMDILARESDMLSEKEYVEGYCRAWYLYEDCTSAKVAEKCSADAVKMHSATVQLVSQPFLHRSGCAGHESLPPELAMKQTASKLGNSSEATDSRLVGGILGTLLALVILLLVVLVAIYWLKRRKQPDSLQMNHQQFENSC